MDGKLDSFGICERILGKSEPITNSTDMRIAAIFSLVLMSGVSVGRSAPSVINTAYNPATGHNYLLLSPSDWLSAESAAISLGGHLITINNQAENDWVFNQWGHTRSLLLGLTDAEQEGVFKWTSGETFGFSNWNPGEPNNAVGWGPGPENYVHMYADGWGTPGLWNDYSGGSDISPQPALHGVVEVPEPAGGGLVWMVGITLYAKRQKFTSKQCAL